MDNFIFISYSSKDKPVADAICHFLEENNIPCWIAPRDISPGEPWAGSIVRAIKGCSAMVLVYSQEANSSHQVANEIDKAFTAEKTIIPFMVDPTPMNDDFDYYLSRKHWLVAYPDYKEKMKPLLEAVNGFIAPVFSDNSDEKPLQESPEKEISENKPDREQDSDLPFKPSWSREATASQKTIISELIKSLVPVQGGVLTLGATPEQKPFSDKDESPAHEVELSSFYICKYLVTQRLWTAVMGYNPSKNKGDTLPVEKVSYNDAVKFIIELNKLSGLSFGLPTEAQWEFAARGGIHSHGFVYSGSNSFEEVGWNSWDGGKTQPVGLKKPNELGIYDMSGNVGEWCCEQKGKYTSGFVKDPRNYYKPGWFNEDQYVYRGGDIIIRESSSVSCRVSYRACLPEDSKNSEIGFRLILNR